MQAFGLYGHIRANRIRSVAMLAGLYVLAVAASYGTILAFEGYFGGWGAGTLAGVEAMFLTFLPWVLAGTTVWILAGYAFNVGMIARMTGAREAGRADEPRIYGMLEALCISRGMAVPRLMIVDTPALNAFASGTNEKQYTITLTSALIAELTDAELEAVIAHELTHIRNGDVKLMIVAIVIAGVISFLGEIAFRGMRHTRPRGTSDAKGGGGALILIGVAVLALSWFLALVLRFALSRSREYLADAGAVELTKNPDAMISALLKIAGRADIPGVPSGIMDMCVENDPDDWGDIFHTHPSIAKRVQALTRMAGGRQPEDVKPSPPRVEERGSLPDEVVRRVPWGPNPPK
ncbi:MAG: M48 family metallopeptidase [Tagaea sp.]|nr:M48 family metallopeptidase [Tagaea sp.]